MRLDRLVSELNIATRSKAKDIIRKGRIIVDDSIIKSPDYKVDENRVVVTYEGKQFKYKKYKYFMLNKPEGVVSATEDNIHRTVIDILTDTYGDEFSKGYFPVGRLDIDTTGLQLLTNDGSLSHRMLSPRHHVNKKYYVKSQKKLNDEDIKCLTEGVDLGDFITAPAICEMISDNEYYLTITEGKFHQVKRMFEAVDNKVIKLHRISFGSLELDKGLLEGEIRELFEDEEKTITEWT